MDSTKTTILLIAILFSIGAAFGGYFLGKYIDTKAMEEKSADGVVASKTKLYENKSLDIVFNYPSDLELVESILPDTDDHTDILSVKLSTDNGSALALFAGTPIDADSNLFTPKCDKALPEGNDDDIFPCVFISSYDSKFSRFMKYKNDETGEENWYIALPTIDADKYIVDNNKYFSYTINQATDLVEFDKIIGSLNQNYIEE